MQLKKNKNIFHNKVKITIIAAPEVSLTVDKLHSSELVKRSCHYWLTGDG